MTDIDTAALREVAQAASSGPWQPLVRESWAGDCVIADATGHPIAILGDPEVDRVIQEQQHMATFDPPTALALLDEVDRLRATLARVEAHADDLTRQAAEHGASDSPFVWALRPLMTALGEVTPTALTPDTKETDR